jgi:hypothetical protein
MVDRRGGLGFLDEPLPAHGVVRDIGRQNLQRHFAVKGGVFSEKTSPIPPSPIWP